VASNGELRIFGLGGQGSPAIASALPARGAVGPQSETYSGSIIRAEPTRVWLNTVDQGILEIDTRKAQQERLSVHLEPGESITVRGTRIGKAVQAHLHCVPGIPSFGGAVPLLRFVSVHRSFRNLKRLSGSADSR
jgi:hypothetical protein